MFVLPFHKLLWPVALAATLLCGLANAVAAPTKDETDHSSSCLGCRFCRAGSPQTVAWYAQPSFTPRETGCYVGGGAALHGEPRLISEGTWGWDYTGVLNNKRVWLNWWHGQRAQGSGGGYRTDGPRLVQPH